MSAIESSRPGGSENDLQEPPSGAFVLLAIVATFVLLIAMLSLLFYRAMTQRSPSNALIVQADERWRGVSLTIEGGSRQARLQGTLDKANKYVVTFFLDPGMYTFRVRYGDQELYRDQLNLGGERETVGIDLGHSNVKPPSTQPTSQPARTLSARTE